MPADCISSPIVLNTESVGTIVHSRNQQQVDCKKTCEQLSVEEEDKRIQVKMHESEICNFYC